MNRNQYEIARRARIVAAVAEAYPDDTPDEQAGIVEDWIADELAEQYAEQAYERETFGEPEDTPCVQSCDFWGTGEGRYHGVI